MMAWLSRALLDFYDRTMLCNQKFNDNVSALEKDI